MFDDPIRRRQLAKWVVGVVSACILVYLCLRHVASLAAAVSAVYQVIKPLVLGIILALFLNVPMSFIEERLLKKYKGKGKRPIAILLSLLLVFGILVGVAFLVVPELVEAIKLLVEIIGNGIGDLEKLESSELFSKTALGSALINLNIDWMAVGQQLEEWFTSMSSTLLDTAVDAAGSVLGSIVTGVIALVFSIYILGKKETLKRQVSRLIRVWLPQRLGELLIHVSDVCGSTLKLFVAGQSTEAIILGTLCMLGMAILRIPYAPMVGALVGVTALIPIVGAWIGAVVGTVMILTVNPWKAFVFLIFLLVLQQVEANAIYPKVVGSKINLPAIWVLAAITVGGNIAGPFGMLLGVPAASAAYILLKEATDKREVRQVKIVATEDKERPLRKDDPNEQHSQ